MDTATTIRFCDLVIGLTNFVELLAFALPIAGLLACGLIATSRHVNRRLDDARHASGLRTSRIPASRASQVAAPTRHRQPKPGTALTIAA
ncbi:MAG: hypothetical protein B6D36_06530 [Planctomycetes bacterium UTPLA1]|nr:MAG: hypothetical protein B6D36_06530 [Planctomycetes bacterium UTPLA1]